MWIVGHAQVGWFGAKLARLERRDRAIAAWAGAFPDLDGLSILFGIDAYFAVHHVWLHNVFAASGVAIASLFLAQRKLVTALVALAAVLLHVACDGFGLLALAPLHPASNWQYWPNGGRYWIAPFEEVLLPVFLLWWQWRTYRREGTSILEILPSDWGERLLAWWRAQRARSPTR